MSEPVDVFHADALHGVAHGFLGRRGGASEGIFASLDLGRSSHGENPHIEENRRRAIEAVLPRASLCTLYQIHSAEVIVVDGSSGGERPKADAMVTNRPGLLLGILTADCAPVLFADEQAGVIGAAHAGWKGALGGVTDATLAAMERLGASRSRIGAAVGPCIARASYEVDAAFARRFENDDPANERFFSAGRPGHHQFDLEGYVVSRLAAAGVQHITALGMDTYADEARFFSYRRMTHRREADYGRQISLIGLDQ
jgi:polyphenol oxidase